MKKVSVSELRELKYQSRLTYNKLSEYLKMPIGTLGNALNETYTSMVSQERKRKIKSFLVNYIKNMESPRLALKRIESQEIPEWKIEGVAPTFTALEAVEIMQPSLVLADLSTIAEQTAFERAWL